MASLVFRQVYPGSPHSVVLLHWQKSGTSRTSPVLRMDSPFLGFCTLPSDTALTTHRGHTDKSFAVCDLPSIPFQYLLPLGTLLPIPNERGNDNIQHDVFAVLSPNLLSFHLLQIFSHSLSDLSWNFCSSACLPALLQYFRIWRIYLASLEKPCLLSHCTSNCPPPFVCLLKDNAPFMPSCFSPPVLSSVASSTAYTLWRPLETSRQRFRWLLCRQSLTSSRLSCKGRSQVGSKQNLEV